MPAESEQQEWRRKTLDYVRSINAFVERGRISGWDKAGGEPSEPSREHLVAEAVKALRNANIKNPRRDIREEWPPANEPFINSLERNGQAIPAVHILPDKSVLARIGAPYETGKVVHIKGDSVTGVTGVEFFGVSPDRQFFATCSPQGVTIMEGWLGTESAFCPWPTGSENVPEGFTVKEWKSPPKPTQLIPFPDGKRVLLAASEGIFVLSSKSSIRLLPTESDLREHFEWLQNEYPGDDLNVTLSMEHGAISRDGTVLAIGSQDSTHLIFDENLTLIGDVGNFSDYPHYALFNANDRFVVLNSCHFYNGATLVVPLDLLPGLKTKAHEEDDRVLILDDGSRVYAGAARNDEIIIGDAYGYVRSFDVTGESRWQLYIGSSIGDIDISDDGKLMVVSTCAGYISVFDLDTGQEPHQIGNSLHKETRRWIFWKDESMPLAW